jgi:hypothetical protein
MPTLLELQQATRRGLIVRENQAVGAMFAGHIPPDRLDIYRNTIISGLSKALRLTYSVVERLVGPEFFDGAAQIFIQQHLPRAAYLDQYGEEFADFLRHFPPAASLAYLADVAKLEWAINCSLHASDVGPLELAALAAIPADEQERVCFVAHPSVRLLSVDYPADRIWRAVLAGDDAELMNLDTSAAGPINLVVERRPAGVEVIRLDQPAWHFLTALCDGEPLHSAIDKATGLDASTTLAEHLAAGRFIAFEVVTPEIRKLGTPP